MPLRTLTDAAGPLVTTVERAFTEELDSVYMKLAGPMNAKQLALSRSASDTCRLDAGLYKHFVDHWLTPVPGSDYPSSFPQIAAADIAAEIKRGFAEAATTASQLGIQNFACQWVEAGDQTTFKVIPVLSIDKTHLTIILLTPAPL